MITKQFEGGLIKCGNYWGEERYGHIKLQLVSQSGGEDNALPAANSGFDFGTAGAIPKSSTFPQGSDSNIKRVFLVSRDDKPDQPPRKVVQLQCIGWPDFDVPEKPDTLLKLIQEVNDAACEARPEGCYRKVDEPPVLVHCKYCSFSARLVLILRRLGWCWKDRKFHRGGRYLGWPSPRPLSA